MRKIFLDCGSNLGQGFLKIFEECGMNDEWHFFLFEPNKECYEQLKNKINFKNLDIVNKAVSDESSLVDFTIEYCPTQKSWVGGASHIISDGYITPYYIPNEYMKSSTYKVETIDLSSFIRDNFNKNDYIVLKLDIEGMEFKVLKKMVDDNVLSYIDNIYIEWHDDLLNQDYSKIKNEILEEIKKNNINYKIWY
jgi:FkbM family methyltransferase